MPSLRSMCEGLSGEAEECRGKAEKLTKKAAKNFHAANVTENGANEKTRRGTPGAAARARSPSTDRLQIPSSLMASAKEASEAA